MIALFSPYDDVEAAVLAEVGKAQESITCSLFGISNPDLAHALIGKAEAGIPVMVGLDKRQAGGEADLHEALQDGGVQVRIKKTLVLEHNKFCVIDGRTVVMGSWNWSQSAQKQDNSELILRDCPDQVRQFEAAFWRIWVRDKKGG